MTFRFSKYLPSAAQFSLEECSVPAQFTISKSYIISSDFPFPSLSGRILVCNEFLEKKYSNAQVAFTFWSICTVMILNFLIPVLTGIMNSWIFLLTITTALLLCFTVTRIALSKISLKPVISVYSILVLFYFLNVIPPVPLSLKKMAVFRSVNRSGNGIFAK